MRPRQEAFIREYAIDMNATQAAIRAGYSEKTAQEQGSRLLSNVMVAKAIEDTQEAHAERCNVTIDGLTEELEAARILAYTNGQASAAVTATMGKAKLHGLLVEKREASRMSPREALDAAKREPTILWGSASRDN
jgi:phage terminase small subunit